MDLLQEQVATLHLKIDATQDIVEQLSHQTAEILTTLKGVLENRNQFLQGSGNGSRSFYSNRLVLENSIEQHKDVLEDVSYSDSEARSSDRTLSTEMQIQRLTAQLTAAYNRIAALEEQLLSKRVH
ncbi:hypothetical protein [Leptolyngbya sp. FACHB-711]|uniref:hypothetical protein n=1 Tax=unclassified Leptolyngbya TaxID=2650499 RepID=UPI001683F381|nr:hypothetical protein [Leptolyngbya sp. FACHB-711]MBD1851600.1 hypothetical protein [Cyanobacteria bacterium FACHB-502]MBD2025354.1 hypothetical protein [Leptolyngbya sp. FACHB-711]